VQLNSPLVSGTAATLTLFLRGFTDPPLPADLGYNHRIAVKFNGTSLGEFTWAGKITVSPTFTVPANSLKHGSNQVTVALPGINNVSTEGAWFDALSLVYPGLQGGTGQFQLTGEATPHAYTLTGWPAGTLQDLLNTFVLLGDPALKLNFEAIPYTNFAYLPIVQKNAP